MQSMPGVPQPRPTAKEFTMSRCFAAAATAAVTIFALALPTGAAAQGTIKVGFPMILSGPGALFGEPTLKGAQMFVDEVNAKGGVLGRKKLQLVVARHQGQRRRGGARRARTDPARRRSISWSARFTSAEGPAVSPIAKENKIVFIAPVVEDRRADVAAEHAPLHLPHLHHHHDRRPLGGRDHGQVEREAGRDHELPTTRTARK